MSLTLENVPEELKKDFNVSFYTKKWGFKKYNVSFLGRSSDVIEGFGKHGIYKDYPVAIKRIVRTSFAPNAAAQAFKHIRNLKNLNHINVVKIYEVYETQSAIFIVMEHVKNILYRYGSNKDFLVKAFDQITSGLNYLRSQNIDNRNITEDHILIDSKGNVKLAEFGLTSFNGKYYIQSRYNLESCVLNILKLERIDKSLSPEATKNDSSSPFSADLRKLYRFERILGAGGFGEVALATDRHTKIQVAVKMINKKDCELSPTELQREGIILKQLNHENIIKLFEINDTKTTLYLIMEYASKGDLESYIEEKGSLTRIEAIKIFRQILNGVAYLHLRNVAHRDLKPSNIFRDSRGVIRVADFGLARFCDTGKSVTKIGGTPWYAPPEHFEKDRYDGMKFDVWSLGVILYELLTGELPFIHIADILKVNYNIPSDISTLYADIIEETLVFLPLARPSASEIRRKIRVSSDPPQDSSRPPVDPAPKTFNALSSRRQRPLPPPGFTGPVKYDSSLSFDRFNLSDSD